jgi:ribosomal 50S subunit-recycling heat shock protein
MRVDLLLKWLCLVKTRNQGRKGCEAGCVKVNGRAAKPSQEVREGDILEIRYPRRILVVEVTDVPRGQVPRAQRDGYIRIVRETALQVDDGIWDA